MSAKEAFTSRLIETVKRRQPEIIELAKLVSIATIVDWSLLRRIRLEFLPELDPGIEGDLWASPLIHSRGLDGFVLRREVAKRLQDDLSEVDAFGKQELLERLWVIIDKEHSYLSPIIRLEERLTYKGLSVKYNDEDLEEELGYIARAFFLNPQRKSIARWTQRALDRLPYRVQAQAPAQKLREGALELNKGNSDLKKILSTPLVYDEGRIPFLFRLADNIVEIIPEELDEPVDKGTPVILSVPRTTPLYVILEWTHAGNIRKQTRVVLDEDKSVLHEVGPDLHVYLADSSGFKVTSSEEGVGIDERDEFEGYDSVEVDEREGIIYALGINIQGDPIFLSIEDPFEYLKDTAKRNKDQISGKLSR